MSCQRLLLSVQGLYFFATGLWPLVSIRSFQQVTGEKTDHLPTGSEMDHWLVFTVGVLVLSIALALLAAAWRNELSLPIAVLAISASLGLLAIDVIFVARRVILPVYLIDAALELALLAAWAYCLTASRATLCHRHDQLATKI